MRPETSNGQIPGEWVIFEANSSDVGEIEDETRIMKKVPGREAYIGNRSTSFGTNSESST